METDAGEGRQKAFGSPLSPSNGMWEGLHPHHLWLPLLVCLTLYAVASHQLLLFHTLSELFSIFVALLIGVVAWNTFQFSRNHYLMYLGCGYPWIALLDILHTLSFPGMGVIEIDGLNDTLGYWIGARILEATLLLSAPWFLKHKLPRAPALTLFGLYSLLVIWAVMADHLPIWHQGESGLADVKIYSEYLIVLLLTGSAVFLWRRRTLLETRILVLVIASILLTIASEFSFTHYVSIHDISIIAGHLLKLVSYWLIFIAIVMTSLDEPFRILARSAHTYDAIPEPVLLVDQGGMIRESNRAATEETGRPEHELLGSHCHTDFHDPSVRIDSCPVCACIHRGEACTLVVHPEGSDRWREITLSPVHSTREPHGMVQVIRDISTQKRDEAEIQRHREQLQGLVEERTRSLELNRRTLSNLIGNLTGAVYRCRNDSDWTVEFMSEGVETLTGYEAQEFLDGRASFGRDVIHPDDQKSVWNEVQRGLRDKHRFELTYRILRADGDTRWVLEKGVGSYDAQGELLGLEGFITDITDRKRTEEALVEYSRRLTQMNEELEGFNYSVSHDLRGPLRAIDGFSLVLQEEYDELMDDRARDYIGRVRRAAQRMGRLIDDLLQLSRVSRGELEQHTVDLSRLAEESLTLLRENQPEAVTHLNIQPGLRVEGDPGLLQVAIDNLLGNAWKYSSRDTEIHIEFGAMEQDGGRVYFVRDRGAGFNMEYAHKLFGAFQRLHSDQEYEGTGIGLATVRRIIERHGGRIWAESAPGQGSTFYFTLGEDAREPVGITVES